MPKVSIIMPMHNGLPYVGEAIDSIINQTFEDWELLVINDGSTDDSPGVVREYMRKDNRIRFMDNDTGFRGAGPTRNCGIEHAVGEYVATMDADDISLPDRLKEQVKFMDTHPDIAMSGCWAQSFGDSSYLYCPKSSDVFIKALLFFHIECWGPSIIFRREVIKIRYPTLYCSEDTVFCVSISLQHRVANIPKAYYLYRDHSNSTTKTNDKLIYRKQALAEMLPKRLGFVPSDEQLDTHLIVTGYSEKTCSAKQKISWLLYVLIHGKYKWYERLILIKWYIWYFRNSLRTS